MDTVLTHARQLVSPPEEWLALAISAAAFYLLPWPVLYLPALALVLYFTWRHLNVALALVILFAPFFMFPKHIGSKEFAPSEIFLLLDVLVAVAYTLLPSRRRFLDLGTLRSSPFLFPALLLLVAAALSSALAADRHLALDAFRLRIFEPLLFFSLLLTVKPLDVTILGEALIAAGFVVGLVALFQLATHTSLTIDAGALFPKVRSVYGSPDNVGLLYDRVAPICLAALLLAQKRRALVLLLPVSAVLLVTLFFTFSRGAWLAIGLVCLIMVALHFHRLRPLLVALALAGLALAALEGPRLAHAVNAGHVNTATNRLYIWGAAVRIARTHPLFGIGPDNFLHYYAPSHRANPDSGCASGLGYVDQRLAGTEPCQAHPHDEFLDFWLSAGVLGLAAFGWIQWVFWRGWWRIRRSADRTQSLILLGVGGAMLASLIHGLVDNSYFLPDLALLFWLLCAYVSMSDSRHVAMDTRT